MNDRKRSFDEILNTRIPVPQRLIFAFGIFFLGVLFHDCLRGEPPAGRSILLLPFLALPYAIQACALLLTRAVLGCAIVVIVALGFLTYDLNHIPEWSIVGKEAGFAHGFIFMGEIWLAIHASLLALIFGAPVQTSNQST